MTNKQHKEGLSSDTKDRIERIDDLPLHPKNKSVIHERYVLYK